MKAVGSGSSISMLLLAVVQEGLKEGKE